MSFGTKGKDAEQIKCLQFELWQDCDNLCDWCYLKTHRVLTDNFQKVDNINKAIASIINLDIREFNAIGLIGGEFFQGQLLDPLVKTAFYDLIRLINKRMLSKEIQEFWLTASLIKSNQTDLFESLSLLELDKYAPNQRVLICTSYDTLGRFHTKEAEQTWFKNLASLKKAFPKIVLHTQTILTQHLMESVLLNPKLFDNILMHSMLDFKIPNYFRDKDLAINGVSDFRELLCKNLYKFPKKFFIENRKILLQFLPIYVKIFGKDKLNNLINYPTLRSHTLQIFSEEYTLSNRWEYNSDRYLPCGHLIDGRCYIDSDRCMYCDIENFIRRYKN